MFVVSGVLVLYDMRHRVIPEAFLYAFLGLTTVAFVIRYFSGTEAHDLASPLVVSLPLLLVYFLTKKRGIGLGDMLLFVGVGLFLNSLQTIATFIIAVWMATIVGVSLQFLDKKSYTMKYALPFVPFIVLSMFLVLFLDIDVWTLVSIFS
jgi:prepilin signal peptidase PulO-like enzyme (type II secretory pathway)